MAVNLRQTHFRFGINELTESTHGWHAAEDANASIPANVTFLLRFVEQEAGGTAAGNTDAQFQYNRNGLGWNNITTTSSVARAVNSVAFANGANCTKRLSGTGTFETSGAGCTTDGTSGGAANDIVASGNSETECAIQIVGTDVSPGDVIQFRFTSPDWAVGYDVTPSLTVSSGNVTVAPPFYSVVTATFEPTVIASDNQVVVPPNATLASSAFAPTVQIGAGGTTVVPPSGTISTASFSPAIAIAVHPAVASVAVSLYAPALALRVTPASASVAITALAPVVVMPSTVVPATRSVVSTAFAPSLRTTTEPGVAAVTIDRFAPIVIVNANLFVTPGTASVSTTGFAPMLPIIVTTRVVSTSAFAPSVLTGPMVTPEMGVVGLPSFAPAVLIPTTIVPGSVALTTSSSAPLVLSFTTFGPIYTHRTSLFGTSRLQACFRSTYAGPVYAQLADVTVGGAVVGSQVSTSSGSLVCVESAAMTLLDGRNYRAQFGRPASGGSGEFVGASIVMTP